MLATTVACPQCQAPLRSAQPIPTGARLKCPKCAAVFNVPASSSAANGNGPTAVAAGPPPVAVAVPPLAAAVAAAPPDVACPRGKRLPLLGAGGGLLLLGAVGIWLLANRSKPEEEKLPPEEEPAEQVTAPPVKRKQRPLIVLTRKEEKLVTVATNKGIAYLKKMQAANGSWDGYPQERRTPGGTAIAGLTLLECGVPASDPAIQRAAYFLRDVGPSLGPTFRNTYELSLAILFFNRLGDAQDKELIQKMALRLVAGQTPQAGWAYTCPILNATQHYQLMDDLRRLRNLTPKAVVRSPGKLPAGLPPGVQQWFLHKPRKDDGEFFRGGGDNSCTQFALLALWAAQRHDLPLKPTLALVAQRFAASQNPDGSWNYSGHGNASPVGTPTMTCAGLLGLAVGHGLKEKGSGVRPLSQDPAIRKAFAVLRDHIQASRKDGRPLDSYYLWSVQRVAVLYQLKTLDGEDWYRWGMDRLLAKQDSEGGGWDLRIGHTSPIVDTCFALLFLQRANLSEDLTDKLRELQALSAAPNLDADERR
jgi:hypothetical protein